MFIYTRSNTGDLAGGFPGSAPDTEADIHRHMLSDIYRYIHTHI